MYNKGQVMTYTDEEPTKVEEDYDYKEQGIKVMLWTKCYGGVADYMRAWYCGTWYYGEGGSLRGSMVLRRSKVYRRNYCCEIVILFLVLVC